MYSSCFFHIVIYIQFIKITFLNKLFVFKELKFLLLRFFTVPANLDGNYNRFFTPCQVFSLKKNLNLKIPSPSLSPPISLISFSLYLMEFLFTVFFLIIFLSSYFLLFLSFLYYSFTMFISINNFSYLIV